MVLFENSITEPLLWPWNCFLDMGYCIRVMLILELSWFKRLLSRDSIL